MAANADPAPFGIYHLTVIPADASSSAGKDGGSGDDIDHEGETPPEHRRQA